MTPASLKSLIVLISAVSLRMPCCFLVHYLGRKSRKVQGLKSSVGIPPIAKHVYPNYTSRAGEINTRWVLGPTWSLLDFRCHLLPTIIASTLIGWSQWHLRTPEVSQFRATDGNPPNIWALPFIQVLWRSLRERFTSCTSSTRQDPNYPPTKEFRVYELTSVCW